MRNIKITLQIDNVDMTTTITEQEYNRIKNINIDPLLLAINAMWNKINNHDDLKNNPIKR